MPINLIKKYNQLLELNYLNEVERKNSLFRIFNRDITENIGFNFRGKAIRPFKKDGKPNMEILFTHLTCHAIEQIDNNGKKIKSRNDFEYKRSERLHWIKYHIEENTASNITVFSYLDRVNGRNIERTYIFDAAENYVIILEPQRSKTDYYLITAFYLTKEKGGIKQIQNKIKNKLQYVL